jgi:tetratricopeptide (TPR) repeat protein
MGAQQREQALGKLSFPISCSAPAQAMFDRGIALLHHMTYQQARETFRRVTTLDPRCAMAHWGIAMTLFQPLWPTRPGPNELRLGREAIETARRLEPPTERERLFVEAAGAFFTADSLDYWDRIRRWERAMQTVHAALPQDAEATAFYALAHLATAPSDAGARAYFDRAAELLVGIYETNPEHPGAMHYIVHANDAAGRERELPEIVRKYDASAPGNPHALHMPTHISTRLGDWDAVVRGNLRAAEAALAFPAGDQGQFVWDEFPHAIEYLLYAYLQQGADSLAARQLARLHDTKRLEPTFKTAFTLASTRARYALERRDWREAATLMPRDPGTLPWDRFKWAEAVTWFARGLGAAHERDLAKARTAATRLAELEAGATQAGESLFGRQIRVLRLTVDAWLAHASSNRDSSVTLMREAAALEESTPKHAVTPAPTLPASELLGDLLLAQGRTAEALDAYRRSLALYPRRINSLLGAARAAHLLGDQALARTMYEEVIAVAGGGTRRTVLDEARAFIAGPR